MEAHGVDSSPPPRVVVLGTGVAAIEATFLLHSRLSGRVDLQVVSDSERFLFRPNLVYVPFGAEPEASELTMDVVLANDGISLQLQRVEGVDTDLGRVQLADGTQLPYEQLVIATGARPRPQAIPGLSEHAATMWDSASVLTLRERFMHLRGQAREGASQRVLCVGPRHNQCTLPLYEVALMLDTWLRRERAREPVSIAFVTHEMSFAEACGPRMHDVIEREFTDRGMEGHVGEELVDVRAHEATFAGGRTERFDLLVAVPPHVPSIRWDGLPADDRGFLRVESGTRQVLGHPELYAPGDAGDFPIKNAFLALLQAEAVADHIAAVVTGGGFKRPFDPVSMNIIDMLDRAAFAQLPLEVTGDPDHPVRLRAGAEADYKLGVSPAWRMSKRGFASSLLMRFAAGEPFGAGAGWHLMDVGARAMAGMLAD
jgi:NADH dehydrogenase FAD-containing subunit